MGVKCCGKNMKLIHSHVNSEGLTRKVYHCPHCMCGFILTEEVPVEA